MIRVEGLSKYYSGHRAIEDVSFEIAEGEIVGLLGLNGAGKSTILKILGCFLMPSRGTATIEGYSIENDPNKIRSLIGYLPDTPPLYNEMRTKKYLEFIAKLKGVASANVAKYVDEAIGKTNLEEVADFTVGSLSHGFRQRVGIAQAIIHKPKVLIFDEPINGLDPVQIVEMRDLILSLRTDHTVVLSSHILSEITKTCDRMLIIDKGLLVAEGNESNLNGTDVSSMRVECIVDNFQESLLDSIKQINGVDSCAIASDINDRRTLSISLTADCRSAISQEIVKSGCGLLGLTKQGDELENLFMKFVGNS